MKRIEWSSRWLSIDIDPRSWFTIYTPLGSIGIDHFRSFTKQGISRGRCREWELYLPLTMDWQLHLSTRGVDYLTLVDGPAYLRNLNWILDEFDASFNDLAIASLKYHLDHSVAGGRDEVKYEDLIRRLGEDSPELTDEEVEILHPPGQNLLDSQDRSTPERNATRTGYMQRVEEHRERIDQARHDFVNVMRELWS